MATIEETMDILREALHDSHMSMSEDDLRGLARQMVRQQDGPDVAPAQLSVFTELLQELAEYSAMVDEGSITHDEFVELQRIEGRIIRGRKENRFDAAEYGALIAIYNRTKDGARYVLRLDHDPRGTS